jgi:DNA-directed RNA polymerase specialized sigma24 family protein
MPQPRLSPDNMDFIMKMKMVEYSNAEVARKLGMTEGTIRYRVKRALGGKRQTPAYS